MASHICPCYMCKRASLSSPSARACAVLPVIMLMGHTAQARARVCFYAAQATARTQLVLAHACTQRGTPQTRTSFTPTRSAPAPADPFFRSRLVRLVTARAELCHTHALRSRCSGSSLVEAGLSCLWPTARLLRPAVLRRNGATGSRAALLLRRQRESRTPTAWRACSVTRSA